MKISDFKVREQTFQSQQIQWVVLTQSVLSIIRSVLLFTFQTTRRPTNWIYLLNLIFYGLIYRFASKNSIRNEILTLFSISAIMVVNLLQGVLTDEDQIFFMLGGVQLYINGSLSSTLRSLMMYYFIIFLYVLVAYRLWDQITIYLLGLCLLNIIAIQKTYSDQLRFLNHRATAKKEKFASLIRLLHRHIEEPLCILYQSQKTNELKALLLTQKFQQNYIQHEEINVNHNQCLQLLQDQHSDFIARIIDEHFPSIMNPPAKLSAKKDMQLSSEMPNRRISHSQAVLKSFQRYNSVVEKSGPAAQDLESVISPNNPAVGDMNKLIQKLKQPYQLPKSTTTKSPTQRRILGDIESRGYLDVIYEVEKEHNVQNSGGLPESQQLYSGLKPYECLWDNKKCLFLINYEDKIQNMALNKRILELEQQHQYKDDLLATVSHDFKTPLNGMILILEYLESNCSDQQLLYYFEIIKKNAFLLLFMINDIIDYSKISKNQISICPTNFQLDLIINEVIELLNLQAKQKGIELIYQNYSSVNDMFNDPNRLKQIILNLLSNALKFTSQGKISVVVDDPASNKERLSVHSSSTLKNSIKITVQDTGVGIPDDIKPKLFNMYATFDHNNGSNKHGSGLGLVICKKLVGLLGPCEQIEMESQEGKGTSISFHILVQLQQEKNRSNPSLTVRDVRFHSVFHPDEKNNHKRNQAQTGQSANNIQAYASLRQVQHEFVARSSLKNKKLSSQSSVGFRWQRVSEEIQSASRFECDNQEDSLGAKAINMNLLLSQRQTLFQIRERQKSPVAERVDTLNTIAQKDVDLEQPSQFQMEKISRTRYSEELLFELLSHEDETSISILIVDDEVFNVMALKLQLNIFTRIVIDEAYDGNQAIRMINAKKAVGEFYRCIFMDLTMGIMDGYQAGRIINQQIRDGEIPNTYLVALSGHDDDREKDKCLNIGFHGFLAKPIRLPNILSLINDLNCMKMFPEQ